MIVKDCKNKKNNGNLYCYLATNSTMATNKIFVLFVQFVANENHMSKALKKAETNFHL